MYRLRFCPEQGATDRSLSTKKRRISVGQLKRQVNDILDLWCLGATIVRIAAVTGLPPEAIEYVINEYGEDVR
jgi:hypothetical protein